MHINNGTNAKNIYLWSWLCFVVAIVLLSLLPVLIDSHFCILDCAGCYEITQNITWYNPTTYPYRLLHNRASYGVFLYLFPSYFSLSPALRLWFHSGFMLSVACILVFFLTYKATERKWLGAVCAALALCQPSFTENYYTMFKGEPWILTGALWITYRVWQQLLQHVRRSDWLFGIFLLFIDIVAVMFIYSLKETGAAFLGVYILGLPLLAWGAGITVAQTIKRTWLLSLLNIICFLILFHLYINLPVTYGSSDGLGYVVTVSNLLSGTRQLSRYFFDTASYMIPALAATITASVLYLNSPRMSPVRPQIAWTLYFAVFFGGMIAILIPWVGINPRYYLQGIVGGIIWTVLAANLCLSIMHYCKAQIVKVWAALLLMLIAVLLSMHGTYSVLVGQLSEGRVQQQYDATWNDMFEYVVNNTPTNGVAYFVVDSGQGEVLANISISLRVFYGRKDIKCIFPHTIGNLNEPGLICVPYRESPLNYFRLPCSEQASAQFNRNVLPYLGAEPTNSIYRRASIIYATAVFGKPQYKSVWGIPAFWDLQRGTYEFGWKIYYYDGHLQKYTRKKTNLIWRDLLTNGAFLNGLNGWQYWSDARQQSNCIALMPLQDMSGVRQALRIMNPQKKLVGVQQTVQLESNVVYRMSGSVRSVATNASEILFGGRVALWLPPQPEQQLVWMSEYNNWLRKELVFTNQVTGTAVILCNMGYGGVSSSGEFTDVRLERLEESVIIITNDAIQTEKRQNDTNITNKYANIEYQSKENQLRQDNGRNCSIKEAVKLSRIADGLWPSPIYEDIQPLANPPSLFEQPFRTQDMSRVVAMRDAGSLPELRVVLFGDSIVAIGAQEGFGWHEQFRKLVDSTLKSMPSTTRVKLIDASVGGDCTRQMAERLYANVIAYRPHLVIIHVAKTEAWYYHTYFTRLRWIVRTIQQLTDAHVVLWTPTPFLPEIDQTYHDLPHYNSVLQIGNETGCSVVDMRYAFLNNELPLKELLWNDGKHPSRQGQELIARTLGTYCGAALSLTNSVARWSQQSVKAVSDQWQVHDPVKGAADYLGRTGGKLDCLFTGTWVVATFGTVECSNFAFYIDGVQPLYSNQMVMFATTPLPHTNNVNTGEHPFGNKTDFCRPLRIFAGTNAVPEKWTMRFVTPDTFSVSGSVTGFDGILTNASDVVFSTSGRVAVRPSDVWWAGIRMYNPGDIFEFHMVPIAKNDYSAYRLDASGTIAAHLPHGLHILSIGVPATPQNCRVTVTGIDSGSENIDSELVQSTPLTVSSKSALLLNNGAFRDGLKGWQYWSDACQQTNSIALVPVQGMPGVRQALRIMNPHKKLVGVQQTVHLESNAVYRLSGIVRSLATKASEILFGGRVALWLPPQPEQQIVWMSEYNNWLHKELVFTNQVSGTAVVYVHLGYGNVATTGEFTDVRLEKVER